MSVKTNIKEWSKIDISSDGNTIYQGRPSRPMAKEDEPVWFIKKTTIKDNGKTVENRYTLDYSNKWTERATLNYYFV